MAKKIKDENGNVYIQKKPFYKKWWVWLIAIIIIVAATSGGEEDKAETETSTDVKTESVTATEASPSEVAASSEPTVVDASPQYVDRTLTADKALLKITGFEKTTDYDGKPMFYVFFDLTNNSEEAQNVQMLYMGLVNASQNTGATTQDLDYAMTLDSTHQDKLDLLSVDLNPGGTVQGAYAYTLVDESIPVTFEFTNGLFGSVVATEDITIQ